MGAIGYKMIYYILVILILLILGIMYEKYKNYKMAYSYGLILKSTKIFLIPKICHQTWHTKELSTEIKNIIKHNKLLNMDIKFKLYDNEDRHIYIRENFDSSIYTAYKKINPKYGAILADFFRYCVLYNEGGVYLDIKSSFKCKLFNNIIKKNDICILDQKKYIRNFIEWRHILSYRTHEQWLLIFCKGHIYLKNMINMMVESINNYTEIPSFNMSKTISTKITKTKEKILRFTGPDAFSVAVHKSIIFSGIQHREINYNSIAKLEHSKDVKQNLYKKSNMTHYSLLLDPLII